MGLRWSTSTDAGLWLLRSCAPWHRLVELGPAGFESYARLRYVPDPVRPGQDESDHNRPDDHPSELDLARSALGVLARFTSTPADCWFAVWDGYPGSLDLPPGLPLLDLPHRRYGLLRGRLDDLDQWEHVVGTLAVAPAFVWPGDHRWCFASDVDPHWAGIGGEDGAVRALLATSGLDVVRADPLQPQPRF